jgi:hypothetical protein
VREQRNRSRSRMLDRIGRLQRRGAQELRGRLLLQTVLSKRDSRGANALVDGLHPHLALELVRFDQIRGR